MPHTHTHIPAYTADRSSATTRGIEIRDAVRNLCDFTLHSLLGVMKHTIYLDAWRTTNCCINIHPFFTHPPHSRSAHPTHKHARYKRPLEHTLNEWKIIILSLDTKLSSECWPHPLRICLSGILDKIIRYCCCCCHCNSKNMATTHPYNISPNTHTQHTRWWWRWGRRQHNIHTQKKKSITLFANLRSLVAQWCGSVVVGFFFIAVSNRLWVSTLYHASK